jgi:hypothetical protein
MKAEPLLPLEHRASSSIMLSEEKEPRTDALKTLQDYFVADKAVESLQLP